MIFFLFLPLSYCFFLDSFSLQSSRPRFTFFIKSFIFLLFVFFFRKRRRKNTLWRSREGEVKRRSFTVVAYKRVYDDDFSSQNTCTRWEKQANEK
jgi:hypothetical protein